MRHFFEVYGKHAALNLGQALQGLRYLFSHPDVDGNAQRGTLRHVARSARVRAPRVVNDLVFAALPPQWHHTREELSVMTSTPVMRWFQYGYCAWKFDDKGTIKADLTGVDKRWDPRCRAQ